MVKIFTHTVIAGRAIPMLCNEPYDPSTGNIVFTFGTETQEVISCGFDPNVLRSKDMCMFGGEFFSASYRALPGKVNGQLVFSSVLTKAPIRSNSYPACSPDISPLDPSLVDADF